MKLNTAICLPWLGKQSAHTVNGRLMILRPLQQAFYSIMRREPKPILLWVHVWMVSTSDEHKIKTETHFVCCCYTRRKSVGISSTLTSEVIIVQARHFELWYRINCFTLHNGATALYIISYRCMCIDGIRPQKTPSTPTCDVKQAEKMGPAESVTKVVFQNKQKKIMLCQKSLQNVFFT